MKPLALRICAAFVAFSCQVLPGFAQDTAGPKLSDARPGDLRVFATTAIRGPLDAVLARAMGATGKTIIVEYGPAGGILKDEILKGQGFEVAILLPDVNQALYQAGEILRLSYNIATDPVGIGLRGDAKVNIGTQAALKAALLNAKSVKYGQTGAAYPTVQNVIAKLGIAGRFHDSSQVTAEVPLGPGEYELSFAPVSELILNTKLKNLGPVPAGMQAPLVIQAVIGATSKDAIGAQTLIRFLQGPMIDPELKADGMIKNIAHSVMN